jgi:hypothetical protein
MISEAYKKSFTFEADAEKFTNLARLLPIATGDRTALSQVSDIITSTLETTIEYTGRDWFKMSIPALIPRKEKGNASYIRASVQTALNKYFEANPHPKFSSKSVIIFEHIYSPERPSREYRDHDNIEINVVVDLIALYCLIDDSPMLCSHFYTSKVGEKDTTNVYIIPKEDFPFWLTQNS